MNKQELIDKAVEVHPARLMQDGENNQVFTTQIAQTEKPKKDLSDAIFAMLEAVDALIGAGENEYARQLKDAAGVMQAKQRQKLADEEKRKFVGKCYEAAGGGGHNLETYLMDLYDAGCRFTENKAAS